jgi:hypothetical protein
MPRRRRLALALLLGISVAVLPGDDAGAWRAKSHGHGGSRHGGHGGHHHHGHHRHPYYYGYYGYGYYGYGYPYWGSAWRPYWGAPYRSYRSETPTERGFRHLVEGEQKRAVSVFAKLAEEHPEDALPKLGYAIAMSELHELELGVWAMRRAIRTDADALRDARLDPALRPRIRALLDVYHPEPSDADRPDAPALGHGESTHFMVAALLWVLGDYAGASSATRAAIEGGDDDASTHALAEALSRLVPEKIEVDRDPELET